MTTPLNDIDIGTHTHTHKLWPRGTWLAQSVQCATLDVNGDCEFEHHIGCRHRKKNLKKKILAETLMITLKDPMAPYIRALLSAQPLAGERFSFYFSRAWSVAEKEKSYT